MDTLNLVFIGYDKKFALLAAYDDTQDLFKFVCKIEAPRFDDEESEYAFHKDSRVITNHIPTIWVKPEDVWEIDAVRISNSSFNSSGLSIRQPKFIDYRHDLSVKDSTTLNQLKQLYRKQ